MTDNNTNKNLKKTKRTDKTRTGMLLVGGGDTFRLRNTKTTTTTTQRQITTNKQRKENRSTKNKQKTHTKQKRCISFNTERINVNVVSL
jgi:hypothetical protein